MKKRILSALWSIAFLGTSGLSAQSIDGAVISRKTELFLTLQKTISTKTARSGDKFFGNVAVPVTSGDQIIIPTGSYVIGHVELAKDAGLLKGKSALRLKFDTIILPDGTTRQIEAVLRSSEEYAMAPGEEEGTLEGRSSQGKEAASGAAGGATIGAPVGAVATRSWKGLGTGAVVGAAAGALIGVFKRGEDVVLTKGSSVTVQLEDDIRFVKPEPPVTGTPLKPRS